MTPTNASPARRRDAVALTARPRPDQPFILHFNWPGAPLVFDTMFFPPFFPLDRPDIAANARNRSATEPDQDGSLFDRLRVALASVGGVVR